MTEKIKKSLAQVVDQQNKASHWKNSHYDAARHYKLIDLWLGLPSIVLSTIILGASSYSVGREDTPFWFQVSLVAAAIVQGVLVSFNLYMKPSFYSARHKNSTTALVVHHTCIDG